MRAPAPQRSGKLKQPGKAAHRKRRCRRPSIFLVPKPGHLPVHLSLAVQNIDVLLQIFTICSGVSRRAGKAKCAQRTPLRRSRPPGQHLSSDEVNAPERLCHLRCKEQTRCRGRRVKSFCSIAYPRLGRRNRIFTYSHCCVSSTGTSSVEKWAKDSAPLCRSPAAFPADPGPCGGSPAAPAGPPGNPACPGLVRRPKWVPPPGSQTLCEKLRSAHQRAQGISSFSAA